MIEKKEVIESLEETAEIVQKMPRAEFVKIINEVDVETRWEADDIKTPPFTQGLKKIIQATERLAEKGKYCEVDDDL